MNPRSTPILKRILLAALPGGVFMAGLSGAATASQAAEISSGLVISKSSNKNQVHYAVQVDEACAPAGRSPVRPYWRMLERGGDATEPLVESELRAFGVERQDIVAGGRQRRPSRDAGALDHHPHVSRARRRVHVRRRR